MNRLGTQKKTKSSRRKRIQFYVLLYLFLVVTVYCLQDFLLYHPHTVSRQLLAERIANLKLEFWPKDSADYLALRRTETIKARKGRVVLFHGNAGQAANRNIYAVNLAALGFEVYLCEYQTFGARTGKLGENQFVNDGLQIIDILAKESTDPIYVVGESLGCGVASSVLAKAKGKTHGALMITPWDSLSHLAQRKFWFIPSYLMVKDSYDSVKNLAEYDSPIVVVMATQDRTIPNRHSQRLFDSLSCRKKLSIIKDAGHNGWFSKVEQHWWRDTMNFVTGNSKD